VEEVERGANEKFHLGAPPLDEALFAAGEGELWRGSKGETAGRGEQRRQSEMRRLSTKKKRTILSHHTYCSVVCSPNCCCLQLFGLCFPAPIELLIIITSSTVSKQNIPQKNLERPRSVGHETSSNRYKNVTLIPNTHPSVNPASS